MITKIRNATVRQMVLLIIPVILLITMATYMSNSGFDKKEIEMENYIGRAYHYNGDTVFVVDYTISADKETLTLLTNGRKDEMVVNVKFVKKLQEINPDIETNSNDQY